MVGRQEGAWQKAVTLAICSHRGNFRNTHTSLITVSFLGSMGGRWPTQGQGICCSSCGPFSVSLEVPEGEAHSAFPESGEKESGQFEDSALTGLRLEAQRKIDIWVFYMRKDSVRC